MLSGREGGGWGAGITRVQAAQPRKGDAHMPAGGLGTQLWWSWRSPLSLPRLWAYLPHHHAQISPRGPPARRARPFPRLRGKHLANCRLGPVTPADGPSRGKGQGTGPGIQGLAHGSRGLLSPALHELPQARAPGLPPPVAPTSLGFPACRAPYSPLATPAPRPGPAPDTRRAVKMETDSLIHSLHPLTCSFAH